MRTLTTYVEQLDRAAEELHSGTDVGNRLALILIDNVVELLLHKWSESRFRGATSLSLYTKDSRYNGAARDRVLGNRFDEKVKFVKAEGQLSEIEANFVGLCHKFRNEAYHIGLSRENVLLHVSWLYHELACELFLRLDTKTRSHGAKLVVPERVAKHAPPAWKTEKGHIDLFNTGPIAESLHAARPVLSLAPGVAYADALAEWSAHLEKVTDYTVRGLGKGVEEVLAQAQWWKDLFAKVPGDAESGESLIQYLKVRRAELAKSWRPKYDALPFPGWKKRMQRMRLERDGRKALASYDRLFDEISYYDSYIMDAAGIVDQRAEEAMERYRDGRRA